MSRYTGVTRRHVRSCTKRGPGERCGCPWGFHYEGPRGGDGKRRQVARSGFASEAEAKAARDEVRGLYRDKGVTTDRGRVTVGGWLDEWLTARSDPHGEAPLRPSTVESYRQHIESHLRPALGRVLLRDLSARQIESMRRDLRMKGLSEATVTRVTATLRSAVSEAFAAGMVPADPFARARRKGKGTRTDAAPKVDPWSLTEWQAFASVTSGDRLAPLYRLAVDRGLRRGELVGLLWGDVAADFRTLTVSHSRVQVGSGVVAGAPKTLAGTGRVVPLSASTAAILRSWKATQAAERLAAGDAWQGGDLDGTALVFTDPLGRGLLPKSVSQAFRRQVLRAGLRPVRFHDLRHLSASIGAASGESVLEVSRRLGHSDPAFTARVYQHVWEESARASADRLGALLDAAEG